VAELAPEALDELAAAAEWYEERGPGLGDELLAEVDRLTARIDARPASFPFVLDAPRELGIRRALLKRFPFALVFMAKPDGDIRVIAVAHAKRRPGYWIWRVQG
jgi:GNAT superfamily N-acetyltransferase